MTKDCCKAINKMCMVLSQGKVVSEEGENI